MDTPQCGMLDPTLQAMLQPAEQPCLGKLLIAPHALGIDKHSFRCERHAEITKQVNRVIRFMDYDMWRLVEPVLPRPQHGRADQGPAALRKLFKW